MPHHDPVADRHLLAAHCVGGEQVLHHQAVLDLGAVVQEHDQVILPGHAATLCGALVDDLVAGGDPLGQQLVS